MTRTKQRHKQDANKKTNNITRTKNQNATRPKQERNKTQTKTQITEQGQNTNLDKLQRNKRKGKEGFPIEDRKKVKRKKKIEEKNRIIPDQYRKPGKRTEDLLTR